jgi:hypothetical protein
MPVVILFERQAVPPFVRSQRRKAISSLVSFSMHEHRCVKSLSFNKGTPRLPGCSQFPRAFRSEELPEITAARSIIVFDVNLTEAFLDCLIYQKPKFPILLVLCILDFNPNEQRLFF